MTVITAVITKHCIAVGSDSFITRPERRGLQRDVLEAQQSKIVPVIHLRAALSYWGRAKLKSITTYQWLVLKACEARQFQSLQEFCQSMQADLENELAQIKNRNEIEKGIGIHITGYEYIDGYWIPELFVLTNFNDPTYSKLCCLHLTRETYKVANGKTHGHPLTASEYGDRDSRLFVHSYLRKGGILAYNNGDPALFYPLAQSLFQSIPLLIERKVLRDQDDVELYRALAVRPIEMVSRLQQDFYKPKTLVVGGKIHDLVLTPNGGFSSKSGDEP